MPESCRRRATDCRNEASTISRTGVTLERDISRSRFTMQRLMAGIPVIQAHSSQAREALAVPSICLLRASNAVIHRMNSARSVS